MNENETKSRLTAVLQSSGKGYWFEAYCGNHLDPFILVLFQLHKTPAALCGAAKAP